MNHKFFLTVYAMTAVCVMPGYTDTPPLPMVQSLPPQALSDALYQIGGSANDIGQLNISGIPSSDLVKAFTKYADDSDNSRFTPLSQDERNALVRFGFKLQSRGAVSDSAMSALMVDEKMRTGMPKAHIKELMSLVERIKANPNYELTFNDVNLVDSTAPFINIDPFAFSDVLGTLLGPILHATPENIGITSATEDILINAAKTVTGLTQEQMDNLQNIGDTYQGSQQFTPSSDNVTDINQVVETSYYPDSANLLLPFLGAGTLIAMSDIHYAYPNTFYGEGYNQYDRNVVRNPTVENYNRTGAYPRYNNNWANNRANGSQARENGSDNRAQDRNNTSDNRSQARENGSDNRTQDRGDAAGNRGGADRGGGNRGGGGGRR